MVANKPCQMLLSVVFEGTVCCSYMYSLQSKFVMEYIRVTQSAIGGVQQTTLTFLYAILLKLDICKQHKVKMCMIYFLYRLFKVS